MGIKLNRHRWIQASIGVGIFVLITFIIFLIFFFTCSCKAKRIRPRQLPPEDTNAVNHFQLNWLASAIPPQPQEPPPTAIAPQALLCFTNELTFPWYPGLNGWLIIWRTADWQNYITLSYILYEDEDFYRTNDEGEVFTVIRFVDQYPLPEQAFYEGAIITNN